MAERRTALAGGPGVALVEIAAGEDADAEGGEETGADGVEVDVAIGHDAAIGLNGHWVVPAAAGEERQIGRRRRSGRRAEARTSSSSAADEARGVGAGVAVLQRIDGEGEEAGRIEAGPFGQQAGERAHEQGGADEEDQREGHLQR